MDQNQPVDTANEPVDRNDDNEFMDTGVLHDDEDKALRCKDRDCNRPHPHSVEA